MWWKSQVCGNQAPAVSLTASSHPVSSRGHDWVCWCWRIPTLLLSWTLFDYVTQHKCQAASFGLDVGLASPVFADDGGRLKCWNLKIYEWYGELVRGLRRQPACTSQGVRSDVDVPCSHLVDYESAVSEVGWVFSSLSHSRTVTYPVMKLQVTKLLITIQDRSGSYRVIVLARTPACMEKVEKVEYVYFYLVIYRDMIIFPARAEEECPVFKWAGREFYA